MAPFRVFTLFTMQTYFSFYARLAVFAMVLVSASNIALADPSNSDEAALGAAAIVVLAQKCSPEQAGQYQAQAHNHLAYMLQRFSEAAKAQVFDEMRMKTKALQVSSSQDSCATAQRLHSMATHWGYAHILATMPQSR